MISGIRSLSATHDQLIVGWTGDIVSLPSVGAASPQDITGTSGDGEHRIPSHLVTQADREALEAELAGYDEDGQGQGIEGNKGKLEYVPVWLQDKLARGHYEGYCKTSKRFLSFISSVDASRNLITTVLGFLPTLSARYFHICFPCPILFLRWWCRFRKFTPVSWQSDRLALNA